MAELSTVARPYAQALFEAAQAQSQKLDAWSALLAELSALVTLDSVRETLSDPRLGNAQRSELLLGLLKSPSDEIGAQALRRFVDLLLENGRALALPEIAAQFEQLKNRLQGTALAHITSAFALSQAQVQPLLSALEKKFGLKLKPEIIVDESLIGGVRVVVGDQVLDTSVRAQLGRMQDALVMA